MGLGKDFFEAYSDFMRRSTYIASFVEYFIQSHLTTPYHGWLSIGPGNCEAECAMLKNGLNKTVKKLYLVEPDPGFNETGKSSIKCAASPQLEIQSFLMKIQDYEHKGIALDLILSSHSLYYFYNELPMLLERFKTWLSDNGKIIFLIDDNVLNKAFHDVFEKDPLDDEFHDITFNLQEVLESITVAGLQYKVDTMDYQLDVTNVIETHDFSWASILINREFTQEEIPKVKKLIRRLKCPDRDIIPCKQHAVVVFK